MDARSPLSLSSPRPVGAAATVYAEHGWSIFPCHSHRDGRCSCGRAACPQPAKHPRTAHGLHDATSDAAQVAAWWRRWPDANVAVATGVLFDVLDVDGDGGRASLYRLCAQHGSIAATWRARTGGGGEHWFFHAQAGLRNSASALGPGLDIRADGGYVLLAPSAHVSGHDYGWITGPREEEAALGFWPEWVLHLLPRRRDRAAAALAVAPGPGAPIPAGLIRFAEAGVAEGQRNNACFWLACRLVQECGASADARRVLERYGSSCRPAMDAQEVARTWASAQRQQSYNPVGYTALDWASRTPVHRAGALRTTGGTGAELWPS